MKIKSIASTAGAAALALTMWITPVLQGQPLYDRIQVNLPYKITLGEKTLEPGDYTIQQLPDNGGGSRVLLFYTDNGMKFETSAMTIPALDPNTARDTKLILGHVGDDYYIQKIWVQGKDYGYELPTPKGLKSRENEMTQSTVAAQSQPAPQTSAQATKPAENVEPPAETRPAETAQSTQPTPPVEQPATPPVTSEPNTANREMTDQDAAKTTPAPTSMPATAANWVLMLLGGGTLSGAGMLLRRKLR